MPYFHLLCVSVSAHGYWINPSWWTHLDISHSIQCSISSVTKAVVCTILSDGVYKNHLLLFENSGLIRFLFSLSEWSFAVPPYNHKQNVLNTSLNKTLASFLKVIYPSCQHIFTKKEAYILSFYSRSTILAFILIKSRARCNFMVQLVVSSIPHGGPIELVFLPASAPWLV